MKIYNYISLLFFLGITLLVSGCSDDDDGGKIKNLTVINAEYESGEIHFIRMDDVTPLQLEVFAMPREDNPAVTFSLTGTTSGAIEITSSGLITPLIKTPAEGSIPSPLGVDTVKVTLDGNPDVFVKYPVRVYSHINLVTSITLQSSGQFPEIEPGNTFNLAQFVTINPTNATDKSVTYSSEDESIATVDQNGVITGVGEVGQSTNIIITSNDRGKLTARSVVSIIAEAPLYLQHPVSDKWVLSSNLGTKEGTLTNLIDDKNSTFWAPDILTRPIYDPACWLDIDLGEVIKFGQLGYRHRGFNYSHLQCHTFTLQGKKAESDDWTDFGEFVTQAGQIDNYQYFPVENPMELRYLRINFIKGHLRDGKTDWDYSESGNVSVGDLEVYVYNR